MSALRRHWDSIESNQYRPKVFTPENLKVLVGLARRAGLSDGAIFYAIWNNLPQSKVTDADTGVVLRMLAKNAGIKLRSEKRSLEI